MANWRGTARTNYFHVRDADAFEVWVEKIGCDLLVNRHGQYGFAVPSPEEGGADGGFQSEFEDRDGNLTEYDLEKDIVGYLAEGQVAVFVEVGSEGSNILTGRAVAVTWDGRKTAIFLDEIYNRAEEAFGIRPTNAAW